MFRVQTTQRSTARHGEIRVAGCIISKSVTPDECIDFVDRTPVNLGSSKGEGPSPKETCFNRYRTGLRRVDHVLPAVKKTKRFYDCVILATHVSRDLNSGRIRKTAWLAVAWVVRCVLAETVRDRLTSGSRVGKKIISNSIAV